jgi:hypothetical protein
MTKKFFKTALLWIGIIIIPNTLGAIGAESPEKRYEQLQRNLASGWNTWDTYSVLNHVWLPDGLAKCTALTSANTILTKKVKIPSPTVSIIRNEMRQMTKNINDKQQTQKQGQDKVSEATPIETVLPP